MDPCIVLTWSGRTISTFNTQLELFLGVEVCVMFCLFCAASEMDGIAANHRLGDGERLS